MNNVKLECKGEGVVGVRGAAGAAGAEQSEAKGLKGRNWVGREAESGFWTNMN